MTELHIFQLYGLMVVSVGLGMLLNEEFYKDLFKSMRHEKSAMYIGGAIAFVVGYLLIAFKGHWTSDYAIIVEIIGWAAFIKGALIFLLPGLLEKVLKYFEEYVVAGGIVATVIGLVFLYLGYFVVTL